MRDYRLLAQATENLDVDVKIAGFSRFTPGLSQNFPKIMPANMSNRFYKPLELLQLYRDADVVAVCLQPSNWSAGVTALLEAMACGRPIVVTHTAGIAEYLQDTDAMKVIEPGDAQGLQQAIVHLLKHPQEAEAMAQKAHQIANQRYSIDRQIEVVANLLKNQLN
jgi:glycosyltransferase involved in cell wall biosynthesis